MDNEVLEITKKEYDKLLKYKEDYEMLKKEIESLYNSFMCCEISNNVNDIEEI